MRAMTSMLLKFVGFKRAWFKSYADVPLLDDEYRTLMAEIDPDPVGLEALEPDADAPPGLVEGEDEDEMNHEKKSFSEECERRGEETKAIVRKPHAVHLEDNIITEKLFVFRWHGLPDWPARVQVQ